MKPTSEAAFQQQVIDLAHLYGWKVASFRKVRVQRADGSVYWETPVGADGAGWPDLVLVKGGRILAWELKVGTNKPSPDQLAWLSALDAVPGVEADAVWSDDWEWVKQQLMG